MSRIRTQPLLRFFLVLGFFFLGPFLVGLVCRLRGVASLRLLCFVAACVMHA